MSDIFKKRMALCGNTVSDSIRIQSDEIMQKTFTNDLGYRQCKLYSRTMEYLEDVEIKYQYSQVYTINKDQVEYLAQFRPGYFPEKKYMEPDGIERFGFYIEIPDKNTGVHEMWLILGKNDKNSFIRYNILKCNWMFKWVKNKQIYSCLGIIRNRNNYNSGVWSDGFFTSVDNQSQFIIPTTPITETIDYNDKNVLASIGTGKCDGIFQLESSGMKSFMKELKPNSLEDMIAGISLYRPGPMDFIPQYIKGKNDASSISYDCPQLEPILNSTYGCIVYQEQVMQIVRDLAGYSLGRSDLLRRAMSKKKGEEMKRERQIFLYGDEASGIPGCVKNGIDEQVANKIYDEMLDFANYAFNKSHAAAYAVVAYQTAWLKYYYPVEYMAALMTSVIDNPSKVAEYIYASRQMGIQILPPDINNGEADFSVDEGNIRYGLSAIKSVGRPVVRAMLEERRTFGPYKNLEDFITRVSSKEGLNKRTIENLIKAGALDTLGGTRKQFMSIYIQIMDHVNQEKKYSMSGQMSLFDLVGEEEKADFQIRMPDVGEYSKENKLAFEKEVLGVYISGHPLEEHEERWRRMISATTADFQFDEELNRTKVHDGEKSVVGGMIVDKTVKYTKTNQVMAFLTLEDLLGTVEVVIFPRDYEKNRQWLEINEKVFISGRVSEEDEKASKLICEKVIPFERTKRELWIQFPDKETFLDEEQIVYGYLADSEGEDEVIIYCAKERAVKRLPKNRNIQINEQVLSRLMNHFGESRVKVVEKAIENHF